MKHNISDLEIKAMERVSASVSISEEELRQRLGNLMEKTQCELREMFPPQSKLRSVLKLRDRIWFRFRELDLLDIESWVPGMPKIAVATFRGIDDQQTSKQEIWHQAQYQGQNCRGRMLITDDKAGLTKFYFSLEDNEGREISPFYLTVTDLEGRILQEKTRINNSSYPVSEVPMGDYQICLEDESGQRRVIMGVLTANPEP